MILNAYAILDGSLAVLRLPLALFVVGFAFHAWRNFHLFSNSKSAEGRYYLLFLLALLLLGLNLVGWALFYALLQSYVPQWPGVMCIYGVTRIGLGSQGLSRFLPGLIATLQVAKPLVVFTSGAWLALYLANRRLEKSELMPRVLILMLVFGLISAVDAVLEGVYLVIPKSEEFLDAGCCTAALNDAVTAARFVPGAMLDESGRPWIGLTCLGLNAGLPLGLLACRFHVQRNWLVVPLLAAMFSLPVSLLYLVEVAAPTILSLPYHHCPYDLLPAAPETAIGLALYLLGVFSVGWAWLVDRLGRIATENGDLHQTIQRLLFVAAFGYFASLILFTVEMVLA